MAINNKPLSDYYKMIEDYLDLNGNYSIVLAATHPNRNCIEYQCQDNIDGNMLSLYINYNDNKIYNNIACKKQNDCIDIMLDAADNDIDLQTKIINFANKYYDDFEIENQDIERE